MLSATTASFTWEKQAEHCTKHNISNGHALYLDLERTQLLATPSHETIFLLLSLRTGSDLKLGNIWHRNLTRTKEYQTLS